jgi:hypothetical protein
MKRNAICLLIGMCFLTRVAAQSEPAVPDHVNATNAIDALTTLSVSPGYLLYGIPEGSGEIVGNAYLNEEWKKSTVKFAGNAKQFNIPQCKVNLYSNQIEINSGNVIKAIDGAKVESFVLDPDGSGDRFYQNASAYKVDGTAQIGFLEVLVKGKTPLLKKVKVIIKRPDYNVQLNVGNKNTRILKEDIYYFAKGPDLTGIKSMRVKKFASLFGDYASAVEKFVDDNALKLSVEEDLILIFKYVNEEIEKKEGA